MKLGVSVVVCTYNGSSLIPETIRHIAQQQVRPGIDWEFIVVDNASTDNTAQVARKEWQKYQLSVPFSIISQPKQGLSFARELAIQKASYDYVIFCDDDNWLDPDYINHAYDTMKQHPSIGVLGGYGELEFEPNTPLWVVGHGAFANGPQGIKSGKVIHNVVYGAGFVLRKKAFEALFKAGFKPMLTDRFGKSLSSGGDWELCFAIALAGYDIWYDERLKFRHYIPKERISWQYCVRFFEEGAQSFEVLMPYRIRVNMGCKDILTFHVKYLKLLLTQTKRLFPLLKQKLKVPRHSEEEKLITLKLIAVKARIASFKNYTSMKKNFVRILEFEQNNLSSKLITDGVPESKKELSSTESVKKVVKFFI